jgi:hypothetical protein
MRWSRVRLEWQGTKYRSVHFPTTSSRWRTARARLVFPIPPGPRITIRGDSLLRMSTISCNSGSRPWNICEGGGSNEMEGELWAA